MQVLLCILLFAGAMAENPQMGDISFEWQEVRMRVVYNTMDIRMSDNLTDTFQIEMYIASEIKSLQHVVALDMSKNLTKR